MKLFTFNVILYHSHPITTIWEQVEVKSFDFKSETLIGAKRFATCAMLAHHIPDNIALLRDPVFWSRWFPLAIVPNSYRMSQAMFDTQMRLELILRGADDDIQEPIAMKHIKKNIRGKVLNFLSDGVTRKKCEIQDAIECHEKSLWNAIDKLLMQGKIRRVKHGYYQIVSQPRPSEHETKNGMYIAGECHESS